MLHVMLWQVGGAVPTSVWELIRISSRETKAVLVGTSAKPINPFGA